jgi:aryl-alcohol dehydrogenase-like predicted oxidoreductase
MGSGLLEFMDYFDDKNTGLKLSKICFGGGSISGDGKGYGFGEMSERDASELIEYSMDRGINLFDTAPIYGFNQSEKRLGQALRKKREENFIISKAGVGWHHSGRVNMSNDPKLVREMLENSLKNLDLGYIDFYMIHYPDPRVDIRFSLDVLKKAQDNGLIKHIGLSNSNDEELGLAREVCKIEILQEEVNLFYNAYSKLVDSKNTLKTGWGSLDKGILSGKLNPDSKFHSDDCRSWAPWWKKSNWKDKTLRVKTLQESIQEYTPLELAMAYSFKNTDIPICGFKSISQLDGIIKILNADIPEEILTEALEILNC